MQKIKSFLLIVTVFALHGFTALAQDSAPSAPNYSALLKAGDDALANDKAAALASYVKAEEISSNDGERALAKAKQAEVKNELKDYVGAKQLAEEALVNKKTLSPVCKVIALRALGKAQLKGDKNYEAAEESLEEASNIQGVKWALSEVNLMLGDCQRMSGEPEDAMKSYEAVIALTDASDGIKSIAYFNIGLTNQYALKNPEKAKEAYANAVKLNPALQAEADKHSAKIQ